jgi:hypothetical protein
LLSRAIDYAGLFPPAGLELSPALENYLGYRSSEDAWALGRFVVPAARVEQLPHHGQARVELAVVIGPDVPGDLQRIDRFRRSESAGAFQIHALEIKGVPDSSFPDHARRYFEVPLGDGVEERLAQVRAAGGFAKVRTGGTTAEAFPSAASLTRFLVAAAGLRLPFKATAGLHHPLRGPYRLTYEAGAPSGTMYGYLNLAIAATLAWSGAPAEEVETALLESDPTGVRFSPTAIEWRGHDVPTGQLAEVRQQFFHGFGSCSFREPLDELAALRPPR